MPFGKRKRKYATPFSDRYQPAASRQVPDDGTAVEGQVLDGPIRQEHAPPEWMPPEPPDEPVARPDGPRRLGAVPAGAPGQLGHVVDTFNALFDWWCAEGAPDVELLCLPELLDHLAGAMVSLGSKTSEDLPLDPVVGEYCRHAADAIHDMAEIAREMEAAYRQAHPVEIRRRENPRPAEWLWDRE